MKILNLIQCTNLGGMEQASLRLMQGLKAHDHDVQLLSLNPMGQLGPLLERAQIPHEGLPYLGKGGWRSYGLLKKKLNASDADAVIMTGHHLLGSLALKNFRKGHRVLAIHYHHEGVKSDWQWRLIYRLACRRFDAITFPCDFIRREAERIYPPLARLAHTVRYPMEVPPVPTAEEKAAARQHLGLPLDRLIVGNAGWLIPRKRFDVFLETAKEVLGRLPDVLFVIAGDGPDKSKLMQLATKLGIADKVRWLGWQQEMTFFYQSLDVLLFNSDWDALPCTPQETMGFGVPVVCSLTNGGLGEIIDSEQVGFLLARHDTKVLAEKLVYLLQNPSSAAALGKAGRAHLKSICDPDPIVEWHVKALEGRLASNDEVDPRLAKKVRTAIIFHRVGPYHFARTRGASGKLDTTLIEVFKSDDVYGWDPVLGADGFKRVTLFEKNRESSRTLAQGIQTALDQCRPEVVAIPGWADAVAFGALEWCCINGVPVVVMSESTEWDESRSGWKEWVKRRLVRMCAAGLVGGRPHAEYLAHLGMPLQNIFQGYDAVDNDYFVREAAVARKKAQEIRSRLKLPENFFLASARFVEKKNLLGLLEAYARYRRQALQSAIGNQQSPIFDLVLLGDGPLRSVIEEFRSSRKLDQYVHLPGFKQYGELPAYYALAKAFIHASTTEQWGLVVNEAMASGLPVLVSNRCGCVQDLVHEGVNGFAFDPNDLGQLAGLMSKVSAPEFPLAQCGSESQRIVNNWGPERFGCGLEEAIKVALGAPQHALGMLDRFLLRLLTRI